METSNTVDNTLDWFLNSPIYNGEAYLACYGAKKKTPVYPEITAYAISLCCILYERRRDTIFLERAEKCAEYMMKISKNGGIPCLEDGLLYTFDTGIFISGMLDLYAINTKEVYRQKVEESLKWLCSMWNGEQFAAVNDVPARKGWEHAPSVHLVKLAIPLLKASFYLRDTNCERKAFKILDKYMSFQLKEGRFQIDEKTSLTLTHPHCYATEAYLYSYYRTKQEKYLEVAKKASAWLTEVQNKDGSFYSAYSPGNEDSHAEKTTDCTSQATRIWKLLGINQEGIDKAYQYLNSALKGNGLRLSSNSSLKGRLLFWRRPVYSWPTFFYIHSLILPFGRIEYCSELF